MNRLLLALVLTASSSGSYAQAAPKPDIHSLEHVLDASFHLHAQHVPLMSLVSGCASLASKGGVHRLQIATYGTLPASLDRAALEQQARAHLSEGWTLMVHDHSTSANGEDDLVFVQPIEGRVRLLVMSLEPTEMDLVQMELSPEAFSKWKDEHGGKG